MTEVLHTPNAQFLSLLDTAKLRLLKMHREANCGHLGGNFSCIDALMVIFHLVLSSEDRFILSKGHSAGALYATLWSLGRLTDADLATFCRDGTLLPAHPSGTGIPGLMFPTGSLGHGPSLAAGLALAAQHSNSGRRVFCLCSDGEWQEGSCWEALTFSIHHRLDNLTIIVDQNGLQGFGRTEDVISCSDLTPRLSAFGASVTRCDGHDPDELLPALRGRSSGRPTVVIMDTRKGRGLHFEDRLESHYLPLSETQYQDACVNISRGAVS